MKHGYEYFNEMVEFTCSTCGDFLCRHGYYINVECLNRIPCDKCDKQEAA